MMPMNYGCIRMSLAAGVDILPVVSYFTSDKRYTKIGVPFKPSNDLIESINELRSIMTTMMFELIEKYYSEQHEIDSNINCDVVDGVSHYYEKRSNIKEGYWDEDIKSRYSVYKRAKDDMSGVREFESQFIFTPKDDAHLFFQEFNSKMYIDKNNSPVVQIISSEKNGYQGITFGEETTKSSFGFGYNETVLKRIRKK